ncbi:MAG: class I SAM-dependent methyltransferase [Spirochaetia bacterium]
MDQGLQNLLDENPELYEIVYYAPAEKTARLCKRMFVKYLPEYPESILDMGCGTGKHLTLLKANHTEIWGIDENEELIAYARRHHSKVNFQVGDICNLHMGKRFDVITCMRSTFMYALKHDDIEKVLSTFAAHAKDGTLLVLDIRNAASFLGGGEAKLDNEFSVDTGTFKATAQVEQSFDRRNQLLIRRRTWNIPGREEIEDTTMYRMFFPLEIEQLLRSHGFIVAGMFDNEELKPSDLSGTRLYIAAKFK